MTTRVRRRTATSGAVALEFALVALSFIGLMLLVVELGFTLYAQTALDYATKQVARQLLTAPQAAATQASFLPTFCAILSTYLPCSSANVLITVAPLSGSQTFSQTPLTPAQVRTALTQQNGPSVNPGSSGNLVLMNAYYTPNMPLWPLNVIMLVGTAAFLNEYAPS